MVELSNITKQHGSQVLFLEASLKINPGEKVGLVGANGAGKTTIFRMILGEERPDEGNVERPKRLTLGYFRQDFADWRDRSVLAETMAGAGTLAALGEELAVLEERLGDCDAPDYDQVIERYGERHRVIGAGREGKCLRESLPGARPAHAGAPARRRTERTADRPPIRLRGHRRSWGFPSCRRTRRP